jgi:hypothetical protein
VPSFTQWQRSADYPGGTAPFRIAETLGPVPPAHDYLDAVRMYWRRTPEAQYPDGYLGTVNSRRGDRLLDGLKARTTNKPYTRGIHKGERIDQRDYMWPDEFNLMSGLVNQTTGLRWAPPGIGRQLEDERYPTDRKGVGPRSVPVGTRYQNGEGPSPAHASNPDRRSVLISQAPPYSTGIRGNPGMTIPYPGR